MKKDPLLKLVPVFEGVWLYFLLMWGYIAVTIWLYPPTQYLNLSQYVPIKQNLLAVASFGTSFVFFVLWRYLKSR